MKWTTTMKLTRTMTTWSRRACGAPNVRDVEDELGVEIRQVLHRRVEVEQRVGVALPGEHAVLQWLAPSPGIALLARPLAGSIDQDLTHREHGGRDHVIDVVPVPGLSAVQLDEGLVHQSGRLQRRRRALAPHLPARHLVEEIEEAMDMDMADIDVDIAVLPKYLSWHQGGSVAGWVMIATLGLTLAYCYYRQRAMSAGLIRKLASLEQQLAEKQVAVTSEYVKKSHFDDVVNQLRADIDRLSVKGGARKPKTEQLSRSEVP